MRTSDLPLYARSWTHPIPRLAGRFVHLRELRTADAAKLFAILQLPSVRMHYQPPETLEQFMAFIRTAERCRANGEAVCLTVLDNRNDAPVGLYQLRRARGGSHVAEWGFYLDPHHWGTRVFSESATLVLSLVFEWLNVQRLEARVSLDNGRAAAALLKIGAAPEGILRSSRPQARGFADEALWTILRSDWARRTDRAR